MVSYFNLTENELNNKTYDEYMGLCITIKTLRARESLRLLRVFSYPNMKSKQQDKTHREMTKTAYPDNFKKKILRLDDINI